MDKQPPPSMTDQDNNNYSVQGAFNDCNTCEALTSMSPLQQHCQVDGIADTPCLTKKDLVAKATSHDNIEQDSGDYNSGLPSKQYASAIDTDHETVKISSGVNTYDFKQTCASCYNQVGLKDYIQCCFICKVMICRVCLVERKEHKEHWSFLHQLKPLEDYMLDNG